ncbi:MAG: hypothetical protein HW389_3218 [Bacteroidetes bacterium]|nr:hypothetical protein [Bacteroidota bacterium]
MSLDTIGRNDPCPCGSGKKFKHCHGRTSVPAQEATYFRNRRLDAESGELLMKFARKQFGDEALKLAWEEYYLSDEIPFGMSGPDADSFTRWFTFNWQPEGEETLAELFLAEKGSKLEPDLHRFIDATLHSPYSLYQTISVNPGTGLTLRDILRKREVHVTEKSASMILEKGHILLARVVELDGISFFMGTGAVVISPGYLDPVLTLRGVLEKVGPLIDGAVSSETLLEHEEDLREAYFDIEDEQQNQRLEIRNTDGDPLAFHTLMYEISSFDRTFSALKDLEQKATGSTDSELLAEAKKTKAGQPTKLVLHWLKPAKKGALGGNTSLATLTISKTRLVVEVNSEQRSKRIQKEIKKRLGDDAVLLRTTVKSQEGIMKEAEKEEARGKPVRESEHDRLMRESPEARAFMKEMMEKHWADWPDTSLPALRGMTPRKATKHPEGRELLESLLMEFDLRNQEQDDKFLRVDTAKLRKKLGMDKKSGTSK